MSSGQQEKQPIKEFPPKQYGSAGEPVFDARVHIRNEKTGALVKKQHYAWHMFGDKKMFERPIGSGNMFNQAGEPIGKWEMNKENGHWAKVSDVQENAESYEMVGTVEDLIDENSELKAELAALKAEKETKTEVKPTPKGEKKA